MEVPVAFKWVLTLSLSNGQEASHSYDMSVKAPIDPDKREIMPGEEESFFQRVQECIRPVAEKIERAFAGQSSVLLLSGPHVAYNPAHVVSIRFEVVGEKQFQEILDRAQRRLGFVQEQGSEAFQTGPG
ncbi:MAG: hypothetical protein HYU29_00930 [Chloroflexi bacterium]|nr:hypothetical protein [Chloroflexota bacterium]